MCNNEISKPETHFLVDFWPDPLRRAFFSIFDSIIAIRILHRQDHDYFSGSFHISRVVKKL